MLHATTIAIGLLAAVPAASPQHSSRFPVPVDEALSPRGAVVASDGDLTAMLFEDDQSQRVFVAVSDGRGSAFTPPQRIDTDATGAGKETGVFFEATADPLIVRGDAIYAVWRDTRNAGSGGAGGFEGTDLYFARSLDGGATWLPDQALPKGFAPGGVAPVVDYAMAVSEDGQDVYVLTTVDPNFFGGGFDELRITASHDAGATFGPSLRLAPNATFLNNIALAVEGNTVHVAFNGTLAGAVGNSHDLYVLRSTDGAASFPSAPQQLDEPGDSVKLARRQLALAADGGTVAVAWIEDVSFSVPFMNLYTAVSVDGGATYAGAVRMGSEPADTLWYRGVDLAIDDAGGILCAWADDRNGSFLTESSAFFARSYDAGATWTPEVEVSPINVGPPTLAGLGSDWAVMWPSALSVGSAFTRDGGATWTAPIDITESAPGAITGSLELPTVGHNALYDNVVIGWIGELVIDPGTPRALVGGYRFPEVVPQGFSRGGLAQVDLASFSGDAPLAWVAFSTATGDLTLPFGDGRNFGLVADSLLLASLANPGVLLANLAPDGSGQTAAFPLPLEAGTEIFAAAVSLDLGAAVVLDELTDPARIVVQ